MACACVLHISMCDCSFAGSMLITCHERGTVSSGNVRRGDDMWRAQRSFDDSLYQCL
jgi:hypothetical protein